MANKKIRVETSVKDTSLIEIRRQQIVRAGVNLFREKGFHRATTREIAKAAGFSIGTLYEYIRTKEDVLYLVCDSIYNEVTNRLMRFPTNAGTIEAFKESIRQYFLLIDGMLDEFTIMYQETKSLPKEAMQYVLSKELEMVSIFEEILAGCVKSGVLELNEKEVFSAANHLVVQGQSWAFRKWALKNRYTIEEYIEVQTNLFLHGVLHFKK